MIRLVRLVLMLAFAFAQAAAVECPMASPAHERAPTPAAHASADPADHASAGHAAADHASAGHMAGVHAPGGRGHNAGDHAGHDAGHGAAACTLVMGCGTAAAASAEMAASRPTTFATRAPARTAQLYASPYIPIDAPPPRTSSAA